MTALRLLVQSTVVLQQPASASWWLESLRLTVPLVGSLIGAWLGGAITLGRFKKERGFDRRLEWYERTFRELNSLGWRLSVVVYLYERDRPDDAGEHFTASFEELTKFSLTLSEAELYATREGALAVRKLVDTINEQGPLVHAARTQGVDVKEASARSLADLIDTAAAVLARDARRVLVLETLPPRAIPGKQQGV